MTLKLSIESKYYMLLKSDLDPLEAANHASKLCAVLQKQKFWINFKILW